MDFYLTTTVSTFLKGFLLSSQNMSGMNDLLESVPIFTIKNVSLFFF